MDRSGVDIEGHLQKVAFALPALVVGLALRPRWLRRHAWVIYLGFTSTCDPAHRRPARARTSITCFRSATR
jgi:hypothetical protein